MSTSTRAITKRCRPAWDITTLERKKAWPEGRKELCYPDGNTYAQTLGEQRCPANDTKSNWSLRPVR